jgi:hypothetical protein
VPISNELPSSWWSPEIGLHLLLCAHITKSPAVMIKLDIEKAFDTVSWEFLLKILAARGFSLRWRNRIAILLATASTKIMINGSLRACTVPSKKKRHVQSFRQYLFVTNLHLTSRQH